MVTAIQADPEVAFRKLPSKEFFMFYFIISLDQGSWPGNRWYFLGSYYINDTRLFHFINCSGISLLIPLFQFSLFTHFIIYLFVYCLFIYLFDHVFVLIYLLINLHIICLPILFINIKSFLYLFVYLFHYLLIYLFDHLFI